MTKQILISAALLLVLLSSGPFRASFGEGNTDLEKPTEAEHPAVTAIDTQIIEFDQLLTDYESLEHDTTSVVNGLNNLGLYYSTLMMSLARTKSLIARVSQQNRKLRDEGNGLKEENDKLRALINMDKSKLNELLAFIDDEGKWKTRREGYIINIISAVTMLIAGLLWNSKRGRGLRDRVRSGMLTKSG